MFHHSQKFKITFIIKNLYFNWKMSKDTELTEIFKILNQIFTNIGVEGDISSIEEVTDPELYIQIFNIMFPFLTEETREIS